MARGADEEHDDEYPTGRGGAPQPEGGVRARTVWYALGALAVAGVLVLGVLAFLWRTGRLSGVDRISFQNTQLAAYAGSFPTGGRWQLEAPRSVSVSDARVYVTEPDAGRISVFGVDGRFVRSIDLQGQGSIYAVDAVAIGETLYIADTAGPRLLAMPVSGGPMREVAARIEQPTALAVQDGQLLVADAATGIWRLDPETLAVEQVADTRATRGFAGGIAVGNGRIYVSDAGGSRVLEVLLPGGDVSAFGGRVDLPRGVARDGAGRIWVADVFAGTVRVFDEQGEVLGDLEDGVAAGSNPTRIDSPQGLACAAAEDRLFVVDSAAGRVLIFELQK